MLDKNATCIMLLFVKIEKIIHVHLHMYTNMYFVCNEYFLMIEKLCFLLGGELKD